MNNQILIHMFIERNILIAFLFLLLASCESDDNDFLHEDHSEKTQRSEGYQKSNEPNDVYSDDQIAAPDFKATFFYCEEDDWWGAECRIGTIKTCIDEADCTKFGDIGANPDDLEDLVYDIADVIGVSVQEFLDNKEEYINSEYISENEELKELLNDVML